MKLLWEAHTIQRQTSRCKMCKMCKMAVIPPKAGTFIDSELNGTSKTHYRNQGKSYIIEEIDFKASERGLRLTEGVVNYGRSKIWINNETEDEIVIMTILNVSLEPML
uniref:Uncharacterized protein n=1 Tax=Acrobeloides nanus TaxID=290746 RepID=A0A914EL01_9BILA